MSTKHSSGDRNRARRDTFRSVVELLGIFAVVLAGWSACEARGSAEAARDAVEAGSVRLEASNGQLDEGRYESVYEHQLDLWSLAAGDPDLAPYIVGGRRPEAAPVGGASSTEPVSREEEDSAALQAALAQALDFYEYAFVQLAPVDADGNGLLSDPLSADASEAPPDSDIDEAQWESWSTWAAAIREGFETAPGMCHRLYPSPDGSNAHDSEFIQAVSLTGLCDWVQQ
jgi:hypothetical protein